MVKFKLSNVLLRIQDHLREFPRLLYKASSPTDYSEEQDSLAFEGTIDFLTYFNGVSCEKWQRYASLDNIHLYIELVGDPCDITLTGVDVNAVSESDNPSIRALNEESIIASTVEPVEVAPSVIFQGASEFEVLEVELPLQGLLLGGFTLRSAGATEIRNAYWFTNIAQERIRPIKLALSTTTFKKEEYVTANIESIKEDVLECDDPIAKAFHMFVIDNGQTLDARALSDDGVTVLYNPNTGGSGGFARGMLEALASEEGFTHVLLMDDDVKVVPESFKRTFNLLSLTNDEYKDAFINGAMLEMDYPNRQFEDVSYVLDNGKYARIKGNLLVDNLADVAVNEKVNVEVGNAYGAWWYSCIPVSRIEKCGLPLPLFIRCDDVEYGIRCATTYMTMNGICVWHEGFDGKFRAPVDIYQYIRNYSVMNALHEKSNEALFLARWDRIFRMYLRALAYETADLLVDGFEDYLKGPEFLMNANGEELMKANGAKSEKLLPLQEALDKASEEHPELAQSLEDFHLDMPLIEKESNAGLLVRLGRTLPYDKHLLPNALLRNEPVTICNSGYARFSLPQVGTRVYVASERDGKHAHVRVMDRDRQKVIKERWRKVRKHYAEHREEIRQAYKDALPEMTSVEFWTDYLGLNK